MNTVEQTNLSRSNEPLQLQILEPQNSNFQSLEDTEAQVLQKLDMPLIPNPYAFEPLQGVFPSALLRWGTACSLC